MGLKKDGKDKKQIGKLINETQKKKMPVNPWFTAIHIMSQSKLFCRQRGPESSCAKRKTVDIDILIKSRNSDRRIMK